MDVGIVGLIVLALALTIVTNPLMITNILMIWRRGR